MHRKSKGMGRTGWNGNCITDNMYPNRFESAGLLRNGENMAHPQMLTPTQEYNTYVVIIIIVSSLFGVRGKCGFLISHAQPNRGVIVICWWRHTLSVVTHSVDGRGGGKTGSWCKLWRIVTKRGYMIRRIWNQYRWFTRKKYQSLVNYCMPVIFDHFVYVLLSFCGRKFPDKYKTQETREIIVECTLYDFFEGAVILLTFYW